MTVCRGLTDVATSTLERIRDEVASGILPCPLEREALSMPTDAASVLVDLVEAFDAPAVVALLDAVLAERRIRTGPEVELVWTGPDTRASVGRATRVVLRQLFDGANHEVIVAGYSFDHGARILAPLHRAMSERAVRARVLLDVAHAEKGENAESVASGTAKRFIAENWPFGPPLPELFYDPRCADPKLFASLHAKCVVVDGRAALVSSANFTDRGQSRNIEVGVLVTGTVFASVLRQQLLGLINADLLRPIFLQTPS